MERKPRNPILNYTITCKLTTTKKVFVGKIHGVKMRLFMRFSHQQQKIANLDHFMHRQLRIMGYDSVCCTQGGAAATKLKFNNCNFCDIWGEPAKSKTQPICPLKDWSQLHQNSTF